MGAALTGLAVLASCDKTEIPDVDYPEYVLDTGYEGLELAWTEDFSTPGQPGQDWSYESGYVRDSELQDYKASDAGFCRIEDGNLVIEARRDTHEGEADGAPYTFEFSSASIVSQGSAIFGDGRVDIRAKIPTGRGLCPEFVLTKAAEGSGDVPGITLMKYIYGDADSRDRIYTGIRSDYTENGGMVDPGYAISSTFETAWHTYSLVKDGESLTVLIDNRTIFEYSHDAMHGEWPFGGDFRLRISLAVGGVYGGTWGVDTSIFPKRLEVDSISYYRYAADAEE